MSLAFGATQPAQVDEWTPKLSRFSVQDVCRNFLELWRLHTYGGYTLMAAKNSCVWTSLTDNEVQTFLEGDENQ